MATVNDNYSVSNAWRGTDEDDTLAYRGGNDAVDGLLGYDTLVIPYASTDSIIGIYANSSVTLQVPDRYLWQYGNQRNSITATNVEQIQFLDKVVTLQERPATTPVTTPAENSATVAEPRGRILDWGSNGFWTKNKRLGTTENSWLTKGQGRRKKYLIDYSVETIDGLNAGSGPLALSSGGWDSINRVAAWDGTLLYSGNNVIAYLPGIDTAGFDAIQKV